jgi:hypothetical protein
MSWRTKMNRESLHKSVVGALRQTIKAHGPITAELIGSAAKRIVGHITRLQKQPKVKKDDKN